VADTLTQFATVSTDAPAYFIARRVYELAERNLVLGRYATRYELPQRMGTTLRAVRIGRLQLPRTPLTEGTAPDAIAFSITNKDVTVQQWGIVVLLSDVAELTTVHPMLTAAIERTALAMSEMFEREMAQTLLTGTNVTFGGAASNRSDLTSHAAGSAILTTAEIIGLTTTLRRRGAAPIKGPLYGGVIPPQMEADMMADTNFQAAIARGQDLERLDFAKIGTWMGVEWVRSNFLPYFQGITYTSTEGSVGSLSAGVSLSSATYSYLTSGSVKIAVVGRDINSGYERLITVANAVGPAPTTGAGLKVTTPTSTGYVYDIYIPSVADGTAPRLAATNVAANTQTVFTALASAAAKAPPDAPKTAGDDVFVGWVFGRDAFGRVELNGMSMRTYLTPAGASFSNPLAQGRKIGAKVMWNSWILDDQFFERFEMKSAYPSGLP
jgi:N4-gp56 family major capsid protein